MEGLRLINYVDFYVQKDLDGNPPPNDDLDLQLLWLIGVERFGKDLDASKLGDYWMSYIIPNWAEYGMGKNNMRAGCKPPVSGVWNNPFGQSCGCFIRSELWACLAPGNPEQAVRFAYEDAICDHYGEGVYGELFCAAIESAAFVESDLEKLIEIGLSYIPADCQLAKAINIARECYNSGKPWQEARKRILTETPGTFGLQERHPWEIEEQFDYDEPCVDAPSNVAFVVLGMLYGEGDFGKSLCTAVNCGEDTDCSGATLGALFGIIHGNAALPEKWTKPIGNTINTKCVDRTNGIALLPYTTDELTDRTIAAIPLMLNRRLVNVLGNGVEVETAETLENTHLDDRARGVGCNYSKKMDDLIARTPYQQENRFNTFNVILDYKGDPTIKLGEPRKLGIIIEQGSLVDHQQFFTVRLYTSDSLEVMQGYSFAMPLNNQYRTRAELEFDVFAETFTEGKQYVIVDVSVEGRHSDGICKFVLYPEA